MLESLDFRGQRRPAFGAILDFQTRPLAFYEPNGTPRTSLVSHVLTAHVGGSIALWERVRVAANVPVVLSTGGESGVSRGVRYDPPASSQAFGDIRLTVDGRLVGKLDDPITVAIGARLWLPTGSPSSYTGDGGVRVGPRLLAAGSVSAITYSATLGVTLRNPKASEFAGSPVDHELVYGAAVGMKVKGDEIVVGPELYGSTVLSDAFAKRTSPVEILLGGRWMPANGLRLGAGLGTGLAGGYGSPGVRVVAGIEWSPGVAADADGDGVPDGEDACKNEPGMRSAEPAKNGCPAPTGPISDMDGDGIPDKEDACMDVAGDKTDDRRTNGCTDRDGDGILDPLDHCPFASGPKSDNPQKNGCPPPQAVPAEPDDDGDGVPNSTDACKDAPGKAHQEARRNGCPPAFAQGDQIWMLDQLVFRGNTAELDADPVNDATLDAIVAVLSSRQEITKLRIEGHTDNVGNPAALKKLSGERAAAVAKWLIDHGIQRGRLKTVGLGSEQPIRPNDSEEARAQNRRIELHIEEGARSP